MCGIAGFIGFENKIDLAERSNIIQKHRGPDHQSIWHDEHIALSHQRLSIIDLNPRSNQPFEKNGLVISFNGEIYNYKELITSYLHGVTLRTHSDTEVILEMYKKFQEQCLKHFIGMFSFAIYDIEKKTTFIARDHFGIKPLYYTQIGVNIAFSSELKTLLVISGFSKELNKKSLVSAVNYSWVSGADTMLKSAYKLPPAHYMLINKNNSFTVSRYWQLSDHNYNNIVDVREKLQNEIEQSIERHMIADVPVSSFLSGGLDSSLISVFAQKSNNSLSTYTIKTLEKDNKYEKMPLDYEYAKRLSGEKNFEHNEIEVKADIIAELPFIIKMLDEPIGDPAAINTYLICKAAQKKGVKVLLSGMGADEIFFGYRRHKATMLAQKYRMVPEIIRNGVTNIINYLPVRGKKKGYKIRRWIKRFNSFANLPLEKSYMKSYSYYSDKELKSLFVEKYHVGINYINNEHEKVFNEKFTNDPVNQICNTDIQMFMLGLNLFYTDRASMAASVEVRVPFVDKNVIEFAMKIPGKYKYQNGVSKYILKKAAEGIIPKKIIYRKKASFGAPIRAWVSNDLRDMIDDLLSEKNIVKRGFFNYEFVKRIIEDDRDGKSDNAYRIYQLLTIELWCREYLDK